MSSMTCVCGTFFMNGKEYYEIPKEKTREGHNPKCIMKSCK